MFARWKVPIVVVVAAAAIAWLVAGTVARNDIYVSTLAQMDHARARRESVRVMGFVKEGTIVEMPGRLVTEFTLRDEPDALALPVTYSGVTPGLFRDGTSVIASGRLGEDGRFHATELMTKCPSKYEGAETPHGDAAPGHPPAAAASSGPSVSIASGR